METKIKVSAMRDYKFGIYNGRVHEKGTSCTGKPQLFESENENNGYPEIIIDKDTDIYNLARRRETIYANATA